jgi:endonuclease/exonuclease/phosphatase family metal-dependent hydrolase
MRIQLMAFYLCLNIVSLSGFEISDSIIPLIEFSENSENLIPKKYSQNQYNQIVETLSSRDNRIRLVTYNMLFNIMDHKQEEQNRWPSRLPRLLTLIQWMQPDILCSQELHQDQIEDLMQEMDVNYVFFGKENKPHGEIDGIFFRKDRFDLIDSRVSLILANFPNAYPHTLTQIVLEDRKTHIQFSVFNTHLPFQSPDEREYSAKFIHKHIERIAETMPVLFTGDLNTISQRLDMPGLPFFDGEFVLKILAKGALKNTHFEALLGHVGPIATFTNASEGKDGVPFKGKGVPGIILDHIFANETCTILIHAIESAKVDNHFPSDHMPVIVDFILKE